MAEASAVSDVKVTNPVVDIRRPSVKYSTLFAACSMLAWTATGLKAVMEERIARGKGARRNVYVGSIDS